MCQSCQFLVLRGFFVPYNREKVPLIWLKPTIWLHFVRYNRVFDLTEFDCIFCKEKYQTILVEFVLLRKKVLSNFKTS